MGKINSIQVETPTDLCTVVGSMEDGTTAVFNVGSLRETSKLTFKGLISQATSGAPTLIEIYSTITTAITTSRISTGVYRITCVGAFTEDRTFWTLTPTTLVSNAPTFASVSRISTDVIEIRTFTEDAAPSDSVLTKAAFSIEIY